jgi:hypothetical protein
MVIFGLSVIVIGLRIGIKVPAMPRGACTGNALVLHLRPSII